MLNLSMEEIKIFRQVLEYIDEHYVPHGVGYTDKLEMLHTHRPMAKEDLLDRIFDIRKIDWNKRLQDVDRSNPFCEKILTYLDNDLEKLWDCCKEAHLSKAFYEKICAKTFAPAKVCICRLIIAAKFDFARAIQLFRSAGFHICQYNKFDVVMSFFFEKEKHDFSIINKVLYLLDLPMLGYCFV